MVIVFDKYLMASIIKKNFKGQQNDRDKLYEELNLSQGFAI